jgi:hypothetical protein
VLWQDGIRQHELLSTGSPENNSSESSEHLAIVKPIEHPQNLRYSINA